MNWAYLITAPEQLTAEMWRDILKEGGIPAFIKPQDAVSFLGLSSMPCRLMVPQGMVDRAKALLGKHLSGVEGSNSSSEV